MISVVIPLYNKVATIERAINSVLNQTVQDFELIVVNNGSTDGSEKVVETIHDPRIKLLSQDNQGVSMARNNGIAAATGGHIAFLDADDEWMPTFLETVTKLRKQYPECAVFATAYRRCDAQGQFSDIRLNNIPDAEDFIMDNYFEVAATSDPPFCSISVMVSKEALDAIDGFPRGIHQGEDLLTWARLAANYKIAYSKLPQSIFYTGETTAMGIPKRIPADDDPVGKGLEMIYHKHPDAKGLKQYIAHWHKMRASIYLRLPGRSRQCRKEIRTSRRWHRISKLVFYDVLTFIPYKLRMNLLNQQ